MNGWQEKGDTMANGQQVDLGKIVVNNLLKDFGNRVPQAPKDPKLASSPANIAGRAASGMFQDIVSPVLSTMEMGGNRISKDVVSLLKGIADFSQGATGMEMPSGKSYAGSPTQSSISNMDLTPEQKNALSVITSLSVAKKDPQYQAVIGQLKKNTAKQVEEAKQMGVSDAEIEATALNEAIQRTKMQEEAFLNSIQGQNKNNIDQMELLKRAGVKQGLLSRLTGMDLAPDMTQAQLQNIAGAQNVLGEEPLQQGELLKSRIQTEIDLFKDDEKAKSEFFKTIKRPEAMSADATKNLGFNERIVDSTQGIFDLVGVKDESGKIVNLDMNKLRFSPKSSELRQKLEIARNNLVSAIVRKESGAAITEEDVKDAERRLGVKLGLDALGSNPQALIFALQTAQEEARKGAQRLAPNEELRDAYNQLKDKFSDEVIYQGFKARGLI